MTTETKRCRHCCIRISDLTVKIGRNLILDKVNVHVHCGEVIAIVGPNGAGKTTLFRAILGEIKFKGTLESMLGGKEFRRPKIGYVPQKIHIDPDSPVNVADLITAATSRRPVWTALSRSDRANAAKTLSVFSAEHLLQKRIGELSGGELQRVLLAMAMTDEPELLLLDEPATGVDIKGLALFYDTVRNLRNNHDIAVIIVTHDLAGISEFADRIVLLNHSIIAEGSPKDVLSNQAMLRTFGPELWNVSTLPVIYPTDGPA
jgi:zinc transport system ATP-binding protein